MATRYWVGGTGNWNDIAHWSATSGGVGGASVPTMNDDVYFDSNSGTGTVTVNAIANMRDCTFAQTQLITLTNAAYAFNIYGNWTLCSNTYLNTSFTGTGYVYLKATTSVNITSNGCTRAWNRLYFDGVGGEWKLQDNLNIGNTSIYLTNGILDLNNYTLTQTSQFNTATGTKTLTLGSGKLITQAWQNTTATGFTFNQNTGTVEISTSAASTLTGANTFYNLMFTFGANVNSAISLASNITVSNTFTPVGNNASNYRGLIASNTIGTPRTITCNGTVTAYNVDFRYIVGAGTANWDLSAIEGGSGDCGGNSGITFTPAQTQYFKHTLGDVNWSDATKWFSNYERTIAGRVPLPQDDAIFDENSFTGASTLSVNVPRIGGLNMSAVNQAVGFALANSIECYGDKFWSNEFVSYANSYNIRLFSLISFKVLTLFKANLILAEKRGELILDADFNSIGKIDCDYLKDGMAFDFNDYNLKVNSFTTYRPLKYGRFGNGTIEVDTFGMYYSINSDGEGSTLIVNNNLLSGLDTARLNILILKNSTNLNILTSYLSISYVNINHLILTEGKIYNFIEHLNNQRVFNIGKLTAIGTPDKPITIRSITAGQRHTINYTGSEASTVEYCNISDSAVVQADKLYALNSVDGGNNVNWIFIVGYKMYSGANRVLKAYLGNTLLKNIYIGNESII